MVSYMYKPMHFFEILQEWTNVPWAQNIVGWCIKIKGKASLSYFNPFETNGIFHKFSYSYLRVFIVYIEGSQVMISKNLSLKIDFGYKQTMK